MKDLVRIRIADAAEQTRIGKRALERVIVFTQRTGEPIEIDVEHVDPARVVIVKRRASTDEKQRRLAFRSRFSEDQRAVVEVHREQTDLTRDSGTRFLPAETPGDHQMQNEEQLALQLEDDPLTEPVQRDDGLALQRRQGWIDGTQEERGRQPDAVHAMPDDARSEGVQVEQDVGELGHYGRL